MARPLRSLVTGLILAGGRGARMGGVDKGLVVFDGLPLVEHVLQRLRPQVDDVLISANRNLERYARLGLRVVRDADPTSPAEPHDAAREVRYYGPLVGMLAGLRVVKTPWLACVPCDAPRLPRDLVKRLAAQIELVNPNARAAVAATGDRWQPVFCLLHKDLAAGLHAALAHGQYKAQSWLEAIGAVSVEFADPSGFANCNTLDDLGMHGGQPIT